jgi:hypothetical protein
MKRLLTSLLLLMALLCAPVIAFAASPNNTTVVTVGPTITDSVGNVWSINASTQVVVNGVAQTNTSNVVELAFVNNVVWQKNTAGNWFSVVSINSSNIVTWSGATTTSPLPAQGSLPPVSAPLASATAGTWIVNQHLTSFANGPGGQPLQYNYLLPQGYDPTHFSYPIVFTGDGNTSGMNGSVYPRDGGQYVSAVESTGFRFNTVAFRTAHPAIIVMVQCDQTLDSSGQNGNSNCGGYGDAPNSGWNEQAQNALLQYMIANFSVDPTSHYQIGQSLSAIGALAGLVDNNQENPSGLALWTAAIGMSEQLFRPATANSTVFSRMASVPYLAISTPSDNSPASYDQPLWTSITGNSSYPTKANYDSGGMAAIRAGTSQYYYIASSGSPWTVFGPMNADGGDGTAAYAWLFSQHSSSTSGTGKFRMSGGKIIAPNGSNYIGVGVNIADFRSGLDMANAVTNFTTGAPLTTVFPGINFVRLALYGGGSTTSPTAYPAVTSYDAFVNTLTSLGIVVEFEHHVETNGATGGGGQGAIASGAWLTAESNNYAALATHFINNPYVWFGTTNEPPSLTGLSQWQQATYNAIRGTGNNNPILLEVWGSRVSGHGGANLQSGMVQSVYTPMTNVVWDPHVYPYQVDNSTDQATNDANATGMVTAAQTITSADGTVPVIIAEYGPSTTGSTSDVNGDQNVKAVLKAGVGSAAWHWGQQDCCNNLNTGTTLTQPYGQEVHDAIQANASSTTITTPAQVTGLAVGATTSTTTTLSWNAATGATSYTLQQAPFVSQGQIITPGGSLTDCSGGVWTISGGQALLNGSSPAFSANVIELALVSCVIWQENASNQWYSWSAPNWTAGNNPLGAPTWTTVSSSISGTSFTVTGLSPSAQYLYQVAGNNSGGTGPFSASAAVTTAGVGTTSTSTPSRTADMLAGFSVQGCLTGGGSSQCTSNGGASFVADLKYVGAQRIRSSMDPPQISAGATRTALTAVLNAGIQIIAEVPYGTLDPPTQVSQFQSAQAINANAIAAIEQLNEPNIIGSPGLSYNGVNTGDAADWLGVGQYSVALRNLVKSTPSLANIPIYSVSRPGEESSNVGLQYLTVPTPLPSGVRMPAGSVFADTMTLHPYPMDQHFLNSSVASACQPNDPVAGNAFNIETHWNFGQTYVNNYPGLSDTANQALPRTITEFGYATQPTPGPLSYSISQDKAGRCLVNGLLLAWGMGIKGVSIYDLYDSSAASWGIMANSGVPNTQGVYLHNFTTILADTSPIARTFTVSPLNYSLTGATPNIEAYLFEKSNGHYQIALLSHATNWDVTNGVAITVPPTNVTVNFPTAGAVTTYDVTAGTNAVQTLASATSVVVPVTDAAQVVDFFPSSTGTGPTGISTRSQLVAYLKQIQGQHTVSGQYIGVGDNATYGYNAVQTIQTSTGNWLGMLGGNYYAPGQTSAATTTFNSYAIPYWQSGGLVMLTLEIPNPTTGGPASDVSSLNATNLLVSGTTENINLKASLDQIATGLQALQSAGVVVVFRPFHEPNGTWWWWGASCLTAGQYQSLWQYTYNYLTNTKGLANLVWDYSVQAGVAQAGRTVADTFPGTLYVDLTGEDLYGSAPATSDGGTYGTLVALGLPTSVSEFGSGTTSCGDTAFSMPVLVSAFQTNFPNMVLWQQWWSNNAACSGWGMELNANTAVALNNPWVINRGEINFTGTTTTGGGGGNPITWNPGDRSSGIALSSNNLVATSNAAAPNSVRATLGYSTGKYCFQVIATTITTNFGVGVANASFNMTTTGGLGSDTNGIGFYAVSPAQSTWFNGVELNLGTNTDASGDPILVCDDFDAKLQWVDTPVMRAAGQTWNDSTTANPATGAGGASFSGMTCPCFPIFNTLDTGSVATLNVTGPFVLSLPSGFQAWSTVKQSSSPMGIILGRKDYSPMGLILDSKDYSPMGITLGANDNYPFPSNDNGVYPIAVALKGSP